MTEYKDTIRKIYVKKLGISDCGSKNTDKIINLLLKMMKDTRADYTMAFRQLGDWPHDMIKDIEVPKELWSLTILAKHKKFEAWVQKYLACIITEVPENIRRTRMHKVNPRYVLRNWIAQEAISAAEKDNFSVINKIHEILKNPFEEQEEAEYSGYADPPPQWAASLKVSCSS